MDKLNIYKTDMTFDDGRTIHFMYDRDSDDLEIVFERARATCAVELTESIVLRFDRDREKALSLILLSFSALAQTTEIGPRSFPLTGLTDLPEELRRTVVKILTSPPVNRFLKLTCYSPTPTECIPLTYVVRPPALAAVAPAIP